jgi:hypothetical protein
MHGSECVDDYQHEHRHQSLANRTPADRGSGRGQTIQKRWPGLVSLPGLEYVRRLPEARVG